MAGVTTPTFRALCRAHGASLTVAEMLHADLYLSGVPSAQPRFAPDEPLRSAQLYGTEPETMRKAAARLIDECEVRHIDLNFGCPVPKVLRRGGGAAIPADDARLRRIARAVVAAADGRVPVTAKMRLGVFGEITYLRAARILRDEGVCAVTLHARTAEERYAEGRARAGWHHIAALVDAVGDDVSVLGNGDVFTARDALDMLSATGAAGVVVGRGALGRPWLFADIGRALRDGHADGVTMPPFETVRDTMMQHVEAEVGARVRDGAAAERDAVRAMRKWFAWYWQGYDGLPRDWMDRLRAVDEVQQLRDVALSFDGRGVRAREALVTKERGKVDKAVRVA